MSPVTKTKRRVLAHPEHSERHGAVRGEVDLVAVASQRLGQERGDGGLVVDDQDRLAGHGRRRGAIAPLADGSRRRAHGQLDDEPRALARRAIDLDRAAVALDDAAGQRLVVKNGSKIRPLISGGIPGPLSVISMRTLRLAASWRVFRPSPRGPGMSCIAWRALVTRFTTTCFS